MADDFNLTPTNNLEKHLDNILRTAQGEEPQYDLAPNWRTEQYLAAIASALASGGGGSSGGGVLVVTADGDTGTLDKTWQEIHDGGFGVVKAESADGIIYMPIVNVYSGLGQYKVMVVVYGDSLDVMTFIASSASGYPEPQQ